MFGYVRRMLLVISAGLKEKVPYAELSMNKGFITFFFFFFFLGGGGGGV